MAGSGDDDALSRFHRLVATLDYPMFIVTTEGDGTRAGCLVGFTTQCSISPARFIVFLSEKNHTCRTARAASHLGVHALQEDDGPLARLFGHQTGDEVDKFARCRWSPGPHQVPILDGCDGWFVGRVLGHVEGGDHLGFVLEPVEAEPAEEADSLGFQSVKGMQPGHEP